MHQQLHAMQQALNRKFYDRQDEIEALLLAVLAKQHILLIGPAGTGKSALSSMLGGAIRGQSLFSAFINALWKESK